MSNSVDESLKTEIADHQKIISLGLYGISNANAVSAMCRIDQELCVHMKHPRDGLCDVFFDNLDVDTAIKLGTLVDPNQHCALMFKDESEFIKVKNAAGIVEDLKTFKSTGTSASLE